ncbi:MAG: SDR family NAD(P)-dependent oxidoreductase, partial [Chloroflexi bacterium]
MGMLDGKVAIVTGSGRGIGAATATLLGSQGALVVVSDLDPTPAEETAGAIRNAGQVNYSTAKAGITGLTKTLAKEWGRYNVQVNCVCYGFIETRLTAAKEQAEK